MKKKIIYEEKMQKVYQSYNEFSNYQKELKDIYYENIKLNSKYTIDNLIEHINSEINKCNITKQSTITELLAKRINFEEFVNLFKENSIRLHFLLLTKDKLYQFKNNEVLG